MNNENMSAAASRFAALEDLMPLIREQLEAGRQVRFSPRGVSMLPMLRQGIDSVLLSPAPQGLRKFDLPLYRRENGAYILHRVVEVGETYTCIGDNQFQPERGVKHEQIIAVVTEFYRGSRRISVTHPGYRLYCGIWHYSRPVRCFWRRGVNYLRRKLG